LSGYHSNEITVEAAKLRGQWAEIKGLLSQNIYSKRESWATALSLTKQGQKAAHQRKIPLVRQSYSVYLWVKLQKGVHEVSENDD
jgi:hypothetical protein